MYIVHNEVSNSFLNHTVSSHLVLIGIYSGGSAVNITAAVIKAEFNWTVTCNLIGYSCIASDHVWSLFEYEMMIGQHCRKFKCLTRFKA